MTLSFESVVTSFSRARSDVGKRLGIFLRREVRFGEDDAIYVRRRRIHSFLASRVLLQTVRTERKGEGCLGEQQGRAESGSGPPEIRGQK